MVTENQEQAEKILTCQVKECIYSGTREEMIDHLVKKHGFDEPGARALYVSHIVKAAEQVGAVPLPSRFGKTPTYQEVMGDRKIKFFPELPRMEWQKLLNQTFIIEACKIVPDFSGKFGVSSFPLLKILMEDGQKFTTLGSGKAIFNQAKIMNNNRVFPVKVKLILYEPEDGGDAYYSFA
jgi:hypothetical protein